MEASVIYIFLLPEVSADFIHFFASIGGVKLSGSPVLLLTNSPIISISSSEKDRLAYRSPP